MDPSDYQTNTKVAYDFQNLALSPPRDNSHLPPNLPPTHPAHPQQYARQMQHQQQQQYPDTYGRQHQHQQHPDGGYPQQGYAGGGGYAEPNPVSVGRGNWAASMNGGTMSMGKPRGGRAGLPSVSLPVFLRIRARSGDESEGGSEAEPISRALFGRWEMDMRFRMRSILSGWHLVGSGELSGDPFPDAGRSEQGLRSPSLFARTPLFAFLGFSSVKVRHTDALLSFLMTIAFFPLSRGLRRRLLLPLPPPMRSSLNRCRRLLLLSPAAATLPGDIAMDGPSAAATYVVLQRSAAARSTPSRHLQQIHLYVIFPRSSSCLSRASR
jgi:hypothetical protein